MKRGLLFWMVTVLLAVVLPAPLAAAVVVARLRRAPRVETSGELKRAA